MEAFATSLNDAIASTVSKLQPFISQVQTTVTEKTEFLQPYLTEAKTVCFEYIELAQPHVAVVLEKTAPLWILMAQAQDKLPEFEEYSINTVAIAAIVLHVLFYNAIAHLEYNTKLFTTIFRGLAVYLNALVLIASALIRDHYIMRAVLAGAGTRVLFESDTAQLLGSGLIAFGIFLNLWTLWALGFVGMYNGDSFGYIKKKPVTGGPYRFFDDPQYLGTTVVLLGYTVLNQSRIGYGLTGIIYLVFNMSVAFIEGPHMKRIYSDAKTAQKKKEKGKNNKDSKKNI